MARLVVVHPWAEGGDEVTAGLSSLAQAGFDAGVPVRLVTPSSFPVAMVATVPVERVLPDPADVRSTDAVSALFDDVLVVPDALARSLGQLGLHGNDLVLIPEADACVLAGIARFLGDHPHGCALVAGLAKRAAGVEQAGPDQQNHHRLLRAVGNQLRRVDTDRLLLIAAPGDAIWYGATELPNVVAGELSPPQASTVADLLPPWPARSSATGPASASAPLVDGDMVRRGFKIPGDTQVVVVWGDEGTEDVLLALTAVPWAATALVIVVGAQPAGTFPLTVGTLPAPASIEESRVVAALGDLHVVPGAGRADEVTRILLEQGRAVLCRPTPDTARLLSPVQTIDGPLERRLCGLLLRPDLLAALGRRNRTAFEGASCAPA